jgi:hypothetical protein
MAAPSWRSASPPNVRCRVRKGAPEARRAHASYCQTAVRTRRFTALCAPYNGRSRAQTPLHNPVTVPVDYGRKLWCEQRQEAQ